MTSVRLIYDCAKTVEHLAILSYDFHTMTPCYFSFRYSFVTLLFLVTVIVSLNNIELGDVTYETVKTRTDMQIVEKETSSKNLKPCGLSYYYLTCVVLLQVRKA